MVNKKTIGIVLLVAGIIALGLSLAADAIGIGSQTGFGWQQIAGTVAGAVVTAVGLFLTLRS